MKHHAQQFDLSGETGEAFNLILETADDGERVQRERDQRRADQHQQSQLQTTFER